MGLPSIANVKFLPLLFGFVNYFTKKIAGVDEGLEEYTRSDTPCPWMLHILASNHVVGGHLTEDPLDGRRARRTV